MRSTRNELQPTFAQTLSRETEKIRKISPAKLRMSALARVFGRERPDIPRPSAGGYHTMTAPQNGTRGYEVDGHGNDAVAGRFFYAEAEAVR